MTTAVVITPHNLQNLARKWRARQDSNLRPSASKAPCRIGDDRLYQSGYIF